MRYPADGGLRRHHRLAGGARAPRSRSPHYRNAARNISYFRGFFFNTATAINPFIGLRFRFQRSPANRILFPSATHGGSDRAPIDKAFVSIFANTFKTLE
ncbi:hypothetical protein EVAR_22236_1 [Eumeta japonica]|uniref:Uncharacterized protein n=1 Tax=Eumeta variegata TaxID=151549 RepID=A0A4C1UAN0_EUMVA|nr:hypothetical protein EVAR_22236_1 [Eumeta japonica]